MLLVLNSKWAWHQSRQLFYYNRNNGNCALCNDDDIYTNLFLIDFISFSKRAWHQSKVGSSSMYYNKTETVIYLIIIKRRWKQLNYIEYRRNKKLWSSGKGKGIESTKEKKEKKWMVDGGWWISFPWCFTLKLVATRHHPPPPTRSLILLN